METKGASGSDTDQAREKLRLKVAEGNAAGTVIQVDDEFLIGRQAIGEGTLGSDIEISRRHARIARESAGRFLIEDLGSTNGTYVNGRRIDQATPLETGDRIEVGATALVVQVGAIPPTPAAGTEVAVPLGTGVPSPTAPEEPPAAAAAPDQDAPVAEDPAPEVPAAEVPMDDAESAPVPATAPTRISLRIELDLEGRKATLAMEDSEEIQLVLEDGRWRLAPGGAHPGK